jgi:deazaflavin-dependent oxidoreductase (nitroreductase family)
MALVGEYEPSSVANIRNQVDRYERSGGTDGGSVAGKPAVVLTCRGARSGKIRKTPVMRVEHGGVYAVIASYRGRDSHPSWYHNLLAHPDTELQDGPVRHAMVAREAVGAERAVWWQRAVAVWPDYDAYQGKTARLIPVMLLEPAAGAEG